MISSLIYSRTTIFLYLLHFLIDLILALQVFQSSYGQVVVRFLISTACSGAALIKGSCLLEDGAYSGLSVNGTALIRGRCLFEEIRYQPKYVRIGYLGQRDDIYQNSLTYSHLQTILKQHWIAVLIVLEQNLSFCRKHMVLCG